MVPENFVRGALPCFQEPVYHVGEAFVWLLLELQSFVYVSSYRDFLGGHVGWWVVGVECTQIIYCVACRSSFVEYA